MTKMNSELDIQVFQKTTQRSRRCGAALRRMLQASPKRRQLRIKRQVSHPRRF